MTYQTNEFLNFDNLAAFSRSVEMATGHVLDFQSVVDLQTDFLQATNEYLIINIKEYGGEEPDNLLFLTEDKAYVFSKKQLSLEVAKTFGDVLRKPFGKSTVLSFFILNKVSDNHKQKLEGLIQEINKLEDSFSHGEYRNLSLEFERFIDRLEEFHDLVLRLQERSYKQVDTQLIRFDYAVLIAESLSLQARCRRRKESLKELRQEHEILATEELNQKIVRLNDVVKKLTAVTVILMLPTLIASHFGMNFTHMPELRLAWVYPAVIISQVLIMGAGIITFRKIGWL